MQSNEHVNSKDKISWALLKFTLLDLKKRLAKKKLEETNPTIIKFLDFNFSIFFEGGKN